jgi:hypothetical protein
MSFEKKNNTFLLLEVLISLLLLFSFLPLVLKNRSATLDTFRSSESELYLEQVVERCFIEEKAQLKFEVLQKRFEDSQTLELREDKELIIQNKKIQAEWIIKREEERKEAYLFSLTLLVPQLNRSFSQIFCLKKS